MRRRPISLPVRAAAAAVVCGLAVAGSATAARAADIVPGKVLVHFSGGASRQAVLDGAGVASTAIDRRPLLGDTSVVTLAGGESVEAAVARLEADPGVDWAEPIYASADVENKLPGDPQYPSQWALPMIGAPAAWDLATDASKVVVGIVDSGVDATHPDLAGNIWTNPGERAGNGVDDDGNGFVDDVHGWDFIDGDNDPSTSDAHGTHVAGIVGASGDNGLGIAGVAWKVGLLPVKVIGPSGGTNTDQIAQGLAYAGKAARIVNASLGLDQMSDAELQAVTSNPNTLYVISAGNLGQNNDISGEYPCDLPAPNIICVAFSRQDDTLDQRSNYGPQHVQLAAPGANVLSTIPNASYQVMSGSSMAAPMVSGAAALMLARAPWLSPRDIKQVLIDTVDKGPSYDGKVSSGGRLNVGRALAMVSDSTPPRPFTIAGPADGLTTRAHRFGVIWNATTDDVSGLDHYELLVDGTSVLSTGATSANLPNDLPEGRHTLAVRAYDRAGNATTTPAVTVWVDDAAPTTPRPVSPVANAATSSKPTLTWTPSSDTGSGVAYYDVVVDGIPPMRADAGATSITVPTALPEGPHVWGIRAVDQSGAASDMPLSYFTVGGPTGPIVTQTQSLTKLRVRSTSQALPLAQAVGGGIGVTCKPTVKAACGAVLMATSASAKRLLGSTSAAPAVLGRSSTVSVGTRGAQLKIKLPARVKSALTGATGSVRLQVVLGAFDANGQSAVRRVAVVLTRDAATARALNAGFAGARRKR